MIFSQVSVIVSSLLEFTVTKPITHSESQSNVMKLQFQATHCSVIISNCAGSSVSLVSSLGMVQIDHKF